MRTVELTLPEGEPLPGAVLARRPGSAAAVPYVREGGPEESWVLEGGAVVAVELDGERYERVRLAARVVAVGGHARWLECGACGYAVDRAWRTCPMCGAGFEGRTDA